MTSADLLRTSLAAARTHINDLQAEIEAGSRCADRIHVDVSAMDQRLQTHSRYPARCSPLAQYAVELTASIAEQRAILRDLRATIDVMRQALRQRQKELSRTVADTTREIRRVPEAGTARASNPDKVRARSPRRPAQH